MNTIHRRKTQRGGKRAAKIRILMYKNHAQKPDLKIRVQKGPRNNLRDILLYNIANTDNYIMDVIKGAPVSALKERVISVEYKE